MNTVLKAGIASAMALGFGAAHAAVTVPIAGTTTNTDYVLFAEVLSGTTIVGSYAGDSGIAVTSPLTALTPGTVGNLSTGSDAALASLISVGTAAGNTIEWAVQGGTWAVSGTDNANSAYADTYITTVGTGVALAGIGSKTGGATGAWSTGLVNTLTTVASNAGTANSVFASTLAKGGLWDATTLVSNVANWYTPGLSTANLYGTTDTLYSVTSPGASTSPVTLTSLGTVQLTSAGLVFATGSTTAVPLPAAVWLLGSGLLGLAGVGRRKLAAV